ncbi:MAG: FAD-dependent oxidoreductase [Nitrososphaerota archaeon]|jgi:NAD(P)H-nitrite reductase large subunit|nr:FAD-dependent oxidoreductase [Nitrososphaerota archaeon]
MKHVIIGSGAAGIAAAKTIRSINKNNEITIVSSDDIIYSRCMLHKYTGNERDITKLSFVPDDFFSANNITWHNSKYVTGVDTENNRILLHDKTLSSYDQLLIATGLETIIPNVGELKTATNVYGFRNLTDAKAIREKAIDIEKVLIIGARLVGLDVAHALLKLNKTVTIVDTASQIMPLNLDAVAADVYQKLFEKNGCNFRLNSKISGTISNEKGEITHVTLETGEKLACDMVIVATGVQSSVKFLDGSKIVYERGIKVDQHLRTSCKNVYAAGSVIAIGGVWSCAVRQGEVAAKNMCGIDATFTDTFTAKNAMHFFDLPTISLGLTTPADGDVVYINKNANCYQKIILRNNHAVGAILQNNINYIGIWQYLIKNQINLSNIKKSIWDISFADFYDIDEKGQYKYKQP